MLKQKINLRMANQDAAPIVHLVQNDTGREIECNILDFDIPAGATSKLWLIKPSGKVISCNGTISGNAVTVALIDQVVAEKGMCVAQLKITKNGKTLSSFTMHFNFEEDASTNGIISQEEIKLVETFIAEQKKKLDAYIAEKTQDIEKLKTDVGTLSNDLTTLRNDHSTDIESLEQNSAHPIILNATGESIVVEDSAERRVQGLRIFGKSEQNGIPSPDSPIPIVSVGENGEIKTCVHSTQLFDASKLPSKTAGGATVTNNENGSFTISGSGNLTNEYRTEVHMSNINPNDYFKTGNITFKTDSIVYPRAFFKILGDEGSKTTLLNLDLLNKTSVSAEITKDILARGNKIVIGFSGANGTEIKPATIKPMLYQDGDGTWEPYKPLQSLSLQTPNGLPGIPVTSGGNYTDSTGQQWVCDEIDLKRGVYMQRVGRFGKEYFGTIGMNDDKSNKKYNQYVVNNIRFKFIGTIDRQSKQKAYCTNLSLGNQIGPQTAHNEFWIYDEQTLVLILPKEKFPTVEFVKEWLQTSGIEILAPITPVETPLAEEILKAFKSLRTYYPNTVVTNDADTGMELEYIADTQKYIDNKFAEMNQTIVATQKALL